MIVTDQIVFDQPSWIENRTPNIEPYPWITFIGPGDISGIDEDADWPMIVQAT